MSWVVLAVVGIWTLAALVVCTLLWAHGARRRIGERREDYRA